MFKVVSELMYRINNRGPRMVPCGIPILTVHGSLKVSSILTYCCRSTRQFAKTCNTRPLTPFFSRTSRSCLWGTMSKAFARSKNTAKHFLPESNLYLTCSMSLCMASLVLKPEEKPNWFSDKSPFLFKNPVSRSFKHFSNNFAKLEMVLNGL